MPGLLRRGAARRAAGPRTSADGARRRALAHARCRPTASPSACSRPATRALAASGAVQHVGFGTAGTAVGDAGPAERDAVGGRSSPPLELDFLSERIRNGPHAARRGRGRGRRAGGRQPPARSASVTEIVGVATLPSARRRGLAALVTARLVQDARERGARARLPRGRSDATSRASTAGSGSSASGPPASPSPREGGCGGGAARGGAAGDRRAHHGAAGARRRRGRAHDRVLGDPGEARRGRAGDRRDLPLRLRAARCSGRSRCGRTAASARGPPATGCSPSPPASSSPRT